MASVPASHELDVRGAVPSIDEEFGNFVPDDPQLISRMRDLIDERREQIYAESALLENERRVLQRNETRIRAIMEDPSVLFPDKVVAEADYLAVQRLQAFNARVQLATEAKYNRVLAYAYLYRTKYDAAVQ